ncbi:MAG: ribosome silencing factor [Deltaproteobacteria bacterium]|jgi:ribosome-associated protein|nr:ribosome silencing factor [Deltaproteobacteria bacterium]
MIAENTPTRKPPAANKAGLPPDGAPLEPPPSPPKATKPKKTTAPKAAATKAAKPKATATKAAAAKVATPKAAAAKAPRAAKAKAGELPGNYGEAILAALDRESRERPADSEKALSILREALGEDVAAIKEELAGAGGQEPGLDAPKPREKAARPRKAAKKAPLSGLSLAGRVWAAADEHKVESPVLLDLTGLTSVTDYFYVAHAETPRQIKAIAEKISQRAKEAGVKPLGQEGLNQPEASWILIDLGEVIAHLFLPETRAKYDLEGFWADAPRVDPKSLGKPPRRAAKTKG